MPPQSSVEVPGTSTTRTTSPYFSPKSAIAPSCARLLERRLERVHGHVREDRAVDPLLDRLALVRCQLRGVGEVEAQLVGPDRRAGLRDVLTEHLAERGLQEVRRRVVRHRREAHAPRHDRPHAVARGESVAAEEKRLVVVEAVRVDELGARRGVSSSSIQPWSVTWPPPAG